MLTPNRVVLVALGLIFLLGSAIYLIDAYLYDHSSVGVRLVIKGPVPLQSLSATRSALPSPSTTALENSAASEALAEYRALHQRIVDGRAPARVVFNGHVNFGYGNRLYSVMSTFVIALLTDSALFVGWRGISDYIEQPLNHSFYSELNQVPGSELNPDHNTGAIHQMHGSDNSFRRFKNLTVTLAVRLPPPPSAGGPTRFLYSEIRLLLFELCVQPDYYDKLLRYGLVSASTVRDAREVFARRNASNTSESGNSRNSSNISSGTSSRIAVEPFTEEQEQDRLFRVGFEAGGSILNIFWRPRTHLRNYIEQFYEREMRDYFTVGIQLRFDYMNATYEDARRFADCAVHVEHEALKAARSPLKPVRWFVTGDSAEQLSAFQRKHADKSVVSNGTVAHIDIDRAGYERTIVDVELLARCDELIMTGGSTYGFVAAMKRQQLAYFVTGRRPDFAACQRLSLSRPPFYGENDDIGCF